MSWIQTYTGKKFYPLEPDRNEYCIEDIAHALSMKCRFGGHCRTFYSVAEHCVRVASIVKPESKLWALLHDAAEAYLPDVASPIKNEMWLAELPDAFRNKSAAQVADQNCRWCGEIGRFAKPFNSLESRHLSRIAKAFGLSDQNIPPDVKTADLILLATEARDLMGKPPESWNLNVPVLPDRVNPLSQADAEIEFIAQFRTFTAERDAVKGAA